MASVTSLALAAVAHCAAVGIVASLRPHDLVDLFVHQLAQHAQPDAHQPDRARHLAAGTYRVDGHERELHAIRVPGEQTLHIIDVLARPLPEDGDVDQRHVEDRVGGLREAEAIVADYVALAERLGWPPMSDVWW